MRARQLGAQALGDADTPLSSLLAMAAVKLDDTPETRATLSRVLARHSSLVATSAPVGDGVARLVRSPDGTRLATEDADNVVSLIDVATGRVTARYDADGPGPSDVQFLQTSPLAFSPDGRTLAVGDETFGSTPLVLLDGQDPRAAVQPTGASSAVASPVAGRRLLRRRPVPRRLVHALVTSERVRRRRTGPHADPRLGPVASRAAGRQVIKIPFNDYFERMALSPDGSRVVPQLTRRGLLRGFGTPAVAPPWKRHLGRPRPLARREAACRRAGRDTQDQITLVDDATRPRGSHVDTVHRTVDDIAFSDDGRQIAAVSGGPDELITWDISSARPTRTIPIDGAWGVQLEPDRVPRVRHRSRGRDRRDLGPRRLRVVPAPDLDPSWPSPPRRVGFLQPAGDGVHVASLVPGDINLVNERTGQVSPVRRRRETRPSSCPAPGDGTEVASPTGPATGRVQVFDDSGRLRNSRRGSPGYR